VSGFPAVQISVDVAREMFAEAFKAARPDGAESFGIGSLDELQARVEADPSLAELADSLEPYLPSVALEVRRVSRSVAGRNVAGLLPAGAGESLPLVVVGAHHDHLGSYPGVGDTIFNGADDNASGVAAVIELARLAETVPPSERSADLLFITFTAEEDGLLGSQAFFTQSSVERLSARRSESGDAHASSLGAMINLDMIGRNPSEPAQVFIGGPERGAVRELVAEALVSGPVSANFAQRERGFGSDQLPFEHEGIPTVSFFTGLHDDYHGLDDETDKIEFTRMAGIVELVLSFLYRLPSGL
jgi:Zn-dependent M28 family amino/carboxypeptidase